MFFSRHNDFLLAFVIFIALLVGFRIFKNLVIKRLKRLAQKTPTDFDDTLVISLEKIHVRFYDFLALYFALKSLILSEHIDKILDNLCLAVIVFQLIISGQSFVDYILRKFFINDSNFDGTRKETVLGSFSLLIKISLWITGALLLLSNFGFNINSLIASLGIGGIAVALAAQNILGDIFSSFSIYFDKPFSIGDFIAIDNDMGTVEKIGLKSTRIQTLQGEELVISNKELTSTRIRNYKKMPKRRVLFSLALTYDTSLDQLKQIPSIVKRIIESNSVLQFDRVHFFEFGDFSLNIEVVYFHLSADYNEYMDSRESIHLQIKEEFEKLGIEFAFPTQTIQLVTNP
jgi:small-conductance mechanosensitive channel